MRDLRDPSVLGQQLLRDQGGASLSMTYDSAIQHYEAMPDWTGDDFMSSNPAEHHSKTPQNVSHQESA